MSGSRRAAAAIAVLAAVAGAAVATDRWVARREAGERWRFGVVRSRAIVAAPIAAAWDVLADVEGQVRWMHDAKSIRILTPGPVGVGTRAEADVRIFGLSSTDVVEIAAWDPPAHFAIRHLGAFRGEGEFRLEDAGDGATVVTWDERLVPPVLPHLVGGLLWPVLRLVFQADLDRFAALVEGTRDPPPAAVRAASPVVTADTYRRDRAR